MDTNQRSHYKSRELRKVYVDSECLYLKLVLHKNYVNKFNVFNQVSLITLEFFGSAIIIKPENNIAKENNKDAKIPMNKDSSTLSVLNQVSYIDDISKDKIRVLKNLMDEAIKVEDYDEAKRLKLNITSILHFGIKLNDLEKQKKLFIERQDFDSAKIYKMEIEKLKANIKNIDKQLKELNHQANNNNSLDLNRSLGINQLTNPEDHKEGIKDKYNIINTHNSVANATRSFLIDKEKEK